MSSGPAIWDFRARLNIETVGAQSQASVRKRTVRIKKVRFPWTLKKTRRNSAKIREIIAGNTCGPLFQDCPINLQNSEIM